ncbi:MAG: diacylglycerol kinase catalytic region [Clostridia bacterium]|nr:diacylglycerol kinase catalytic region [Clostridia bacterium]
MEHIILVNPIAGRKKGEKYGIRIQKLLEKNNITSSIHVSKYPEHLTKLAKEFSSRNKCRFYSVGGDGTLNEIMQGTIGTDSEIVVTACGTGNDFVRTVSKYKSMRKIITNSINLDSTPIDIMKLNNNKYCINILSAGFDAMVGKNIDKFRWLPMISGTLKYNLSIIYTLFQNKNFRFKLRLNNKTIKKDFTLVAISNGKFYGGGVCPSPDAIVDDGLLDICEIDNTSLLTKIILLPKYKSCKHIGLKQIKMEKTNKISIVSNKQFPVNIDGEVFYTKKLKCEVLPKCIRIVNSN